MRNRARLLVLGLSLWAGACASPVIKPTSNSTHARRTVRSMLEERGFECRTTQDAVQCVADHTYKIQMEYRHAPPRLFLFAWFDTNGKTCAELEPRVRDYNHAYPTQAACIVDGNENSLRFFTSTLVPEGGITAPELEEYLVFWSTFIRESAVESGIFEKDAPGKTEDAPIQVTPT